MGFSLDAFPKMTEQLYVKTGYSTEGFKFGYHYKGEMRVLKAEPAITSTSKCTVLQLTDQVAQWNPDENNLFVEYKCSFRSPQFFFGENGLASLNGSVIGIALMWQDPDANQRGVKEIGEIPSTVYKTCSISGLVFFPEKQLKGTLVLQTILFLKKCVKPKPGEEHLASSVGTVFGIVDETRIIIDGNGSIFPIHEVKSPNDPLWWIRCDWEDPRTDRFTDENVCLYFNTVHKDYPSLNINEGIKNSPLLMEILCSALQIIISKVLNDDTARTDTIQGSNLEEGSVSSMVHYFLNTFGINYSKDNPETVAFEVRKAVMKAF